MTPKLIFVYNADSGLFNSLADAAHKLLSPETYACQLCALTHTNFRMRPEWKRFVERLGGPVEFLHADELKARYGVEGAALPAVFRGGVGAPAELIGAREINSCRSLPELERLVLERAAPLLRPHA